jgi:uncharacterized protein involved in exopolysaccharide biosynthesis
MPQPANPWLCQRVVEMSNNSTKARSDKLERDASTTSERLVYVMPQEVIQELTANEMSLLDLWRILWEAKWLLIGITAIFFTISVIYSLTATEWYRAEVLLAPAQESSVQGLSGTLGGLASLAGVSMGGNNSVEALAVLTSREFARSFIEDLNLLSLLVAEDENAANARIRDSESPRPDIRDGIKFFNDNIRTVTQDRDTGLVTLTIEWTDPQLAAEWANVMVERLNERMRQQALKEAERNVAYLQSEIGQTNVLTLQQSIGRLMENELQKLMLARGNDEFSFRVVDRAQIPQVRFRPRRTLTVILGTLLGAVVALLVVLIRHTVRDADRNLAMSQK